MQITKTSKRGSVGSTGSVGSYDALPFIDVESPPSSYVEKIVGSPTGSRDYAYRLYLTGKPQIAAIFYTF